MPLICSICLELLRSSDQLYATPCGHIFQYACILDWLARSETCPECRVPCYQNSIKRLYGNSTDIDTSKWIDGGYIDDSSICDSSTIDNLICSISAKDQELLEKNKSIEESNVMLSSLRDNQKLSEQTILKLEEKIETNEIMLTNFKDQIQKLTTENDDKVNSINRQMEFLAKNIQNIVKLSGPKVDELLKLENFSENLIKIIVSKTQ